MANIITLTRLLALFLIIPIALYAPPEWQLINIPLIAGIIIMDGVDGIIARWRKETSVFGAVFDIAADRITEITLWMVLAILGIASVWIAIIFVVRGVLVDSLRKQHTNGGKTPFSIMKTDFGKFLVGGRTMRFFSGLVKLVTFCWLYLLIPLPTIWPEWWINYHNLFIFIGDILTGIALIVCLARGLPVIFEAILCKK